MRRNRPKVLILNQKAFFASWGGPAPPTGPGRPSSSHPLLMIPVTWDMPGLKWNDVNLRWGSPSYLIEFHEPGWVYDPDSLSQPPTATTQPKRRTNKMPKSDYIKKRDEEFSAQLTLFKHNIGDYAATFGLSTAQVTSQANDAAYFAYVLAMQDIHIQSGEQWTAWKDSIRGGGGAATPPAAPTLPAAVTPVAPGIERRFRDLVRMIKAHPAYTAAIGELLGIEGPETAPPPPGDYQPEIRLELVGGQVVVRWGWQGTRAFLSALEIEVDRGSGFQLLTIDTTPDYTDTTPLPATAQKWTYRAIFRDGEGRIGQWSPVVSIIVAA
jgi:hypothetical protein